ncbi:MAG TPA: hypothetical protein DCS87_06100 [Rheinheimera sp.]|nr:hypothetical protein [Rheinheimera sp.]
MEVITTLYFKHPSAEVQQQLVKLFSEEQTETTLPKACQQINPTTGAAAAKRFFENCGEDSLPAHEGIEKRAGFVTVDWTQGSNADNFMHELVTLLYALAPEITAKAYGSGDDDPWEFWILRHNGEVHMFDNGALEDEEYDAETVGTIYRLWHQDLPKSIRIGYLIDEDTGDFIAVDDELQISDEQYQAWCDSLGSENHGSFVF